jgi:peptide/nickel transport system substrate-binding protein
MRRAHRTVALAATLGVLGGLVLSGASALAQDASPTEAEKVVFVAGTTNDMRTVNPFNAIESPEYEVLSLNYDMLLNFAKEDLGPAPGLAESWSKSEDGLTWTFKIRETNWQDGEPVTASDVVFTFSSIIEFQLGASLDYLPYSDVDSFVAVDDRTFEWTTEVPTVAPEIPPWIYIVPEHIWAGSEKEDFKKNINFEEGNPPIGSGPFQLTEWVKGEYWTLTANPNYWGGAPKIDQYTVRRFDNSDAMVTALKNGEIDYVGALSPDLYDSLQGTEGITTWRGPATGFAQFSMNACDPENTVAKFCEKTGSTGHPALLDPVVRTAIAWAIDRQTLVDSVLGGYGYPGTTIVPPFASYWHYEPTGEEVIGFDLERAKSMLEDAGYVDTDGDGVREMPGGGQPLEMRFILRSESEASPDLGRFIGGWLEEIGIATETEVLKDGKLISAWYDNDYDLYIWGWGPDPDPDFILSTFTSGQCGSWSDTCYSNATYDDLYDQQQTATSREDRQAIIWEMQKIVYRDVPEVVLYYDQSLEAYRSDKWEGLEENVSPAGEGFLWQQYTPYTALTLAPIGEGGSQAATGVSAIVWAAILGAVVVIVLIVALARRGKGEEDVA